MSHIEDRLIQLKNEVENTGNGAYFSGQEGCYCEKCIKEIMRKEVGENE